MTVLKTKPTLLELFPTEVLDIILDSIVPTPGQRFHFSQDDPCPGEVAWLYRYGFWKDTVLALRLVSRYFGHSTRLKSALFHNINYLCTAGSLERIAEIAYRPDLACLVKRVTFNVNPFNLTVYNKVYEKDLEAELRAEAAGLSAQQMLGQEIERETTKPQSHMLEHAPFTDQQLQQTLQSVRNALTENHRIIQMHRYTGENLPVHQHYFANLPNVECVELCTRRFDIERRDCLRSQWASRQTFLHKVCPQAGIRYLPNRMFAGDPTELKYVLPTFLHSSLQPHTLILSSGLENTFKPNYTPERSGLLNADLSFLHTLDVACHNGTHLLEVLPQLDNLAALRVFGTHKNQKISRLRELDAAGRFPESDYSQGRHVTEMDRTDFLYSIRVPRLKSLTLDGVRSKNRSMNGPVTDFVQRTKTLRHLTLHNYSQEVMCDWRKLFDAVRSAHDELVFDFENFWFCYTRRGAGPVTHVPPIAKQVPQLQRERSESDRQLIAYIEGHGPWTMVLEECWKAKEMIRVDTSDTVSSDEQ